ncbi:MAG: hypothetical protein HC831_16065, partial [Chloroflexia bacterium]|nr:hypothetical protein [Chloroflexia bacterium]
IKSVIYGGVVLNDNTYAISTLANGIIIIDEKGNIIEHLNEENGLPDHMVLSIYYDKEGGNLWFATAENGIFKAYYDSPFREWNRNNGLNGVVADIVRYDNRIYAATSNGIFYLDDKLPGNSKFKPLDGIPYEGWSLLVFNDSNNNNILLAGTSNGIYEISKKGVKLVCEGYIYKLEKSKVNKNEVYVGYSDGFGILSYDEKSKKWKQENKQENIKNIIRDIYEKKDGKLFLGTQFQGVLYLENAHSNNFIKIDTAQGLPIEGSDFKTREVYGKLVFLQ